MNVSSQKDIFVEMSKKMEQKMKEKKKEKMDPHPLLFSLSQSLFPNFQILEEISHNIFSFNQQHPTSQKTPYLYFFFFTYKTKLKTKIKQNKKVSILPVKIKMQI